MSAADVLAVARNALLPLGVPVLLARAQLPDPAPERYIVLDYITGTPVPTLDAGRPGKRRVIQVTSWCRTYDAACTLHDEVGGKLAAAGFREGQDRDAAPDELYVGVQTDWRYV